jgi:hypothetical protein
MTADQAVPANRVRAIRSVPATSSLIAPPNIRVMIVCLPDGMPAHVVTAGHPDQLLADGAAPSSHLWAVSTRWLRRRDLIGVRSGRDGGPTLCAGGPIRWLNLAGMRAAAGFHAGIRYQQLYQAVAGTRAAKPWHEFHTLHLGDPAKMSLEAARTQFGNQARINAMRMFNEANPTLAPLDPFDVEQFQAGSQAYQNYHGLKVVCGDALLPVSGQRLQPDSDTFADRITYLGQAWRLLHALPERQRLLAVTT